MLFMDADAGSLDGSMVEFRRVRCTHDQHSARMDLRRQFSRVAADRLGCTSSPELGRRVRQQGAGIDSLY
ncbi:hypothetical protein DMP17_44295 [Pseudonocardia sp. TMWB2A]